MSSASTLAAPVVTRYPRCGAGGRHWIPTAGPLSLDTHALGPNIARCFSLDPRRVLATIHLGIRTMMPQPHVTLGEEI